MEGTVMAGLVAIWAAYLPGLRLQPWGSVLLDMSEEVSPASIPC